MHACFFAASAWNSPTGTLTIYGSSVQLNALNQAGPTSRLVEIAYRGSGWRGVNFSGPDGATPDTAATSTFSNLHLGTYGTDYGYDPAGSVDYVAARGCNLIRLNVRWERLQPTLGAALDTTELGRITTLADECASLGTVKLMIELHNYGAYYIDSAGTGIRHTINDGTLTTANFTDAWTRIANAYKNHAGVMGYGLMNEPVSMTKGSSPSYSTEALNWEAQAQAAVTAIRTAGSTQIIAVPTYNWSHASEVATYHPNGPWVTDTVSNKLWYEAHLYLDDDQSGHYADSYATETTDAVSEGYPEPSQRAMVTGVQSSATWRRSIGVNAD